MLTAVEIKAQASTLGFDACGIAPAAAFPELGALREWIDRGYAGDMHYLARTAERRADVRAVLPSARSVVVLATVYHVDRPYSTERADPRDARIARYAWGDDYHDVVGARTDALLDWLRRETGAGFEGKAYVDTGPIQERVYAQYAGVGWIGKNTCVISPALGSWVNSTGRRNTSMMRCCDAETETEKVRPGGSACDAFAWSPASSGA